MELATLAAPIWTHMSCSYPRVLLWAGIPCGVEMLVSTLILTSMLANSLIWVTLVWHLETCPQHATSLLERRRLLAPVRT